MIKTIIVGTDGSDTAAQAVVQAGELAEKLEGTLVIVSAFDPVPETRLQDERTQVPEDVEWAINQREDVDAMLSQVSAPLKERGISVRTTARQGNPADAILDVAEEEGADLIVVGNKGMAGARRFLLGSVPNKISHHAPCSVLIVRTT
ncbi:MAG TPA: universal stress protein [Solirubrobacterales bacterium]|nr:universal stress protein [Solirubrobacterales bacterium]